jgi:hypothetical protein
MRREGGSLSVTRPFGTTSLQKLKYQEETTPDDEDRSNIGMAPVHYHEEPYNCHNKGEDHPSESLRAGIFSHRSFPVAYVIANRDNKLTTK